MATTMMMTTMDDGNLLAIDETIDAAFTFLLPTYLSRRMMCSPPRRFHLFLGCWEMGWTDA